MVGPSKQAYTRAQLRWPRSTQNAFLKSGFDDVSFNSTFAKMKFTVLFTVTWCGHRSLGALTDLPSAVTDHSVRSPICPVRSPITQCGHRSALCGHRSLSAVTDLPCAVTNHSVRSPICPVRSPILRCAHRSASCGHRSLCAVTDLLCAVTDLSVRSPICPVRSPHRSVTALSRGSPHRAER